MAPTPGSDALLVSFLEARRLLGDISSSTLRRLIHRGELPVVQLGGRRMIERSAIEALVARCRRDSAHADEPPVAEQASRRDDRGMLGVPVERHEA